MALSCYSNWSFPQPESDLQMDLLGFFLDQNPSIDPIFDPLTDFNNHPKRTKIHQDNTYSYNDLFNNDEFEPVLCPTLVPEFLPQLNWCQNIDCSFPVFNTVGESESCDSSRKVPSTQSVAARQRRKRITDKTQELGKLIPGAHKMNTAEMFGAAYKYIQFLQAQVGILEFMSNVQVQDNEDHLDTQELQQLVSSSQVQQKLYSSEKCLVPKQLLHSLQGNARPQINSNSTLSKELQNWIKISG